MSAVRLFELEGLTDDQIVTLIDKGEWIDPSAVAEHIDNCRRATWQYAENAQRPVE